MTGDLRIGDVIDGRYELRRELGTRGRMFEATHRHTGRRVALKVVARDVPPEERAKLAARLAREAKALASIRHPGVVEVLDGGFLDDGAPFLVMDLLEGRTLEGLLAARGRLTRRDTTALALELASALDVAHAAGLVHRDVATSNILVVKDHAGREQIKLIDFGLARVESSSDRLTGIGALIGTAAYMAPEQLLALDDVDNRCDIYALGIIMFECLSGRRPYEGTYQEVLLSVCSTDPAPLLEAHDPEVPQAMVDVVHKAMAKERPDRYWWMKDLIVALRAAAGDVEEGTSILGPRPTATRPPAVPEGQRRKWVRAPYVTPVRVTVGALTIDGRTEDISTGGVLIVCHQVCSGDSPAIVRLSLPMEGTVVSIAARVRWVKAARESDPSGPRALGVEWVDLPSAVRSSIARYVELMTRGEDRGTPPQL